MDIRQLIEHAFQKLKFVMLYEMEQLIINTYIKRRVDFGRTYFNKMGSMIWLYKSISKILQIKIAIYVKWQAFVQISYYVSKKKYCNMLQWFIVGLLAFEVSLKCTCYLFLNSCIDLEHLAYDLWSSNCLYKG